MRICSVLSISACHYLKMGNDVYWNVSQIVSFVMCIRVLVVYSNAFGRLGAAPLWPAPNINVVLEMGVCAIVPESTLNFIARITAA